MTNCEHFRCVPAPGFDHNFCTKCGAELPPEVPYMEVTDITPEVIEPAQPLLPDKQQGKITARGVAVDKNYFWIRIDKDTPVNIKMQLYSEIAGLPSYGKWDGKSTFYSHYQYIPSLPPVEGE